MQWLFWLVAVALSAGAAWWVFRADKKRAVPYPAATATLRGLLVFFTALLVLVPSLVITRNNTEKPVVVLLQDDSRSIAAALGKDSAAYQANATRLAQQLSSDYKVVQWGFGSTVHSDNIFHYDQPATDISAALERVQEYYGTQNLGAVILASDGMFNQGTNPMYGQGGFNAAVYTVGIGDSAVQKDIRITQVYANKVVSLNSTFEVRADVVAALCKGFSAGVTLKEGDKVLGTSPLNISSDRYDGSVAFTIKAEQEGLHHYVLSVPAADGEQNTANNRRDLFVNVTDEKKNVLIASASPHPDVFALKDALSGIETFRVTTCTADNFPASLDKYDVIILHGLPSVRSDIAARLVEAHKPVWLIVTNQSSVQALNKLQPALHVTFQAAAQHDVQPALNTAFNTFTLPQQVQSITDKMPPLNVAATMQLLPGAGVLFQQKNNPGEAMWMLGHGSEPFAVLGGEGIWRWRLYEFKTTGGHAVIDECIRQTVSFLSANNKERQFSVVLPKYVWSDQEPIALNAYLLNANNEQINTPDASITITDSAGHKHEYSLERSGNAYSLNIGIWAGGNYSFSAQKI